jgi:hypothetical protein
VNALSPTADKTIALISGSVDRVSKTTLNSSHIASKNALSFSGLLICTWATKGEGVETRKCL